LAELLLLVKKKFTPLRKQTESQKTKANQEFAVVVTFAMERVSLLPLQITILAAGN
jgi:hypothetical protein